MFWRVVVLIAVLLFACFVWPTRFRYSSVGETPVRFDRFTGHGEHFEVGHGWVRDSDVFERLNLTRP